MSRPLFDVPTQIETASPEVSFDVHLSETAPDQLTVQLIGDLDIASAELVTALLRYRRCPKVMRMDLSGLTFADCSGLRAIEAVRDRLHANGGRLVLMNAGARLRWLLTVMGLGRESTPAHAQTQIRGGSRGCASLPY